MADEEREGRGFPNPYDIRPVPDPTALTNAAVREAQEGFRRELLALKELIFSELNCVHRVKAEKFAEIDRQFANMESQRREQKADNKITIDAAMAAQQTAVNKQELAVEKQLVQLKAAMDSTETDLRRSINVLETRLSGIDGRTAGGKENMGWIAAIAGIFLLLLGMLGWISHNSTIAAGPVPAAQHTN